MLHLSLTLLGLYIIFFNRFLEECRPLSVSMMNTLQYLKNNINEDVDNKDIKEVVEDLIDVLENFERDEIEVARKTIIDTAKVKLVDGDVVLTYGR